MRGRCSHHHHDTLDRDRASSLTPTLRSQRSISSQKSISSLKNFQEDVEKLNVIFLISRTSNKLVDSLDLYPSPEKMEDCIGSKVITSNDVNFNVMYHQELSSLKSNQSHTIGSMNMVVMVYSDMAELQEIVNNEVGIISHIRKYWRGYLPLMLIQVGCPNEAIKESCLDILERDYSSCFCLHVNDPCSIDEILVDRCIKYFLHNEKFLCHKVDKTTSTSVNQSLHEPSWKCSGLCGLKSSERDSLRKKKRSVINAIRRKISRHDTIIWDIDGASLFICCDRNMFGEIYKTQITILF